MRLDVSLQQKLQLQLKLAPQIIQSIEILQLPALDLKDMIDQELLENETLELQEPRDEEIPAAEDESSKERDENDEYEQTYERLENLLEADGFYDSGSRRPVMSEDGRDRKLEAIQNTAARPPGLQDGLISQLSLMSIDERLLPLVRAIIYSLDEGGFLLYDLSDVLKILNSNLNGEEPYTVEDAEIALRIVQELEPKGVGARDLVESLLLQITDDDPRAGVKRRLIGEYLEDLNKNRLPKVARELGITIEELTGLVTEIAHLSPRPGSDLATEETHYIAPDVVVEWVDGEYEVRLEDTYFPTLRISPRYLKMLRDHKRDPKVREHIKKKIESARWLIDSIEQRQNTLEKVVRAIIRRQRDFLDFGISHLRPLKMQEIADELGIHVSTVSRAIADKHIQCHRGIFPLKFFFTGGTDVDDGSVESRASVKQKVQEIVDAEDKSSPLSDEDIAKKLRAQGLNIARRTVTKYRKQLKLPSSRQRRVWT
jgi:RNA polymerase sigma-54 factor